MQRLIASGGLNPEFRLLSVSDREVQLFKLAELEPRLPAQG